MTDAAAPDDQSPFAARFPWAKVEPGRLIGRGHPAGDFLEAWKWDVVDEEVGFLRIQAHLPDQVKNPRGQLFGGFTPTYVDMISLFTTRAGPDRLAGSGPRTWLATTSMRLDYFEPIVGPVFIMESREEKARGRTHFVVTRFLQDGELAVLANTTMRSLQIDRPLGDA
jgi:acyl-coenzyme A thioesterase PaaI-like protein